jgi:nucleoside-diphosphate-sugar epimerase
MEILVTGGSGFLGRYIIRDLLQHGHQVRSLQRRAAHELDALGVKTFYADLEHFEEVSHAVRGCDAVFHVAAKAGVAGPLSEYERINYQGTLNILAACRQHGVGRLVYTSSPSVVYDGKSQTGVDESLPYPRRFMTAYQKTKAAAEEAVLKANSLELRTVSLRPHLIWGPGDNHLIPRLVARAKKGRLRLVGAGDNLIDTVYVENAAAAHLIALDRLISRPLICGKAYFITNQEPWSFEAMLNGILEAYGMAPVKKRLPYWLAYAGGALCEELFGVVAPGREPPLTRFVVKQLATSHYFNHARAQEELGYRPHLSIREGLQKLKTYQGVWLAPAR